MSENETGAEVRRLCRVLKQMSALAEQASRDGTLSGGAADTVEQYNRVLLRLSELKAVSPTLFASLPDDASFDRVGVVSKMLASYLADEEAEATKPNDAKISDLVPKFVLGSVAGDTSGMAGLEEFKDLGRMIRDSIPEIWRKRTEAGHDSSATPLSPVPPVPSTPPTPPTLPDSPIPMPDFAARFK